MAAAHQQQVEAFSQAREARRAQLDAHFAGQLQGLKQALQTEIDRARTVPEVAPGERWHLYLISKAQAGINGLIAAKQPELARQQALATAFADSDMGPERYATGLAALPTAAQMQQLYTEWNAAYAAAGEAALLQEAISQLQAWSAQLATEHAEQAVVWQAREAQWEAQRQYAEQREARILHKQQADEDRRLEHLKQAATFTTPTAAVQSGGALFTQAGVQVAADLAATLEHAVANAAKELLRIAAMRAGQAVSLTAQLVLYSPALGNGELTPAQRQQRLQGAGLRAELLGVASGQDLQAIADQGGTAQLSHRLKIEQVPGGSAIAIASTGAGIAAEVPVRNAVFDPITETYRVEAATPTGKTLVFGNAQAAPETSSSGGILPLAAEVSEVAAGVDLRFDDCIVCLPGQAAQYFSFALAPPGSGVVNGQGVAVTNNWWPADAAAAAASLPVPEQVGRQLRGRTFSGLGAFESEVWRSIASDRALLGQFDPVNQHRILNGFAPIAAKARWRDGRSAFELRHAAAAGIGSGLYDLSQLRLHSPADEQGIRTVIEPFAPWFAASVAAALDTALVPGQPNRTWTPLVVPGAELLGSTRLPAAPPPPTVLPGGPAEPIAPTIEILPGEEAAQTGAIIPGFGDGTELPESGLVNYEPAEPLEVGEYKDLSRRSINDRMDVDHIVSRKALQVFLVKRNSKIDPRNLKYQLENAPNIVIPTEVHRRFSQTYGGRNSRSRQLEDASDLRAAVDMNIDALKPGLLEYGFPDVEIESARQQLHDLHSRRGYYE